MIYASQIRPPRPRFLLAVLAVFLCALPLHVQAEAHEPAPDAAALPVWELGLGLTGRVAPDYPAAADYQLSAAPRPYLVYRGDFFGLRRQGAPGPVGIAFSGAVSRGVDSDDSQARAGLPDLDRLIQFGPEFILRGPQFAHATGSSTLDMTLQARAALSLNDDFELAYEGYLVRPTIRYTRLGLLAPDTRLTAQIGPIFGSEGIQDFYYEVDPAFASPSLAAFDADAGYLGTELGLEMRYPLTDRLRLRGGASVTLHAGAANADSPLYREDVTASAFLGFTYTLFQSRRSVSRP